MNEKFYDLSREKQDRMLSGGMQIFGLNGYRHASTDEMVKVTRVSKGLWFHYFENKKGLYYYICSYGVKYALLEMSMKAEGEKDFFKLRYKLEEVRVSLADKYPYLPILISSMLREMDEEAVEIIANIRQQYIEKYKEIMLKADYTIFESREDASRLNEMLDATFDRLLMDSYRLSYLNRERYLQNVEEYLNMSKKMTILRG